MAIYAIGDIHGSLKALETIFNQDLISKEDTVVFLGDYVDRGPDSKGVLDWLLKHQKTYDFHYILGNHEIMMKEANMSPDKLLRWLRYGGTATLDSYGIGDDSRWVDQIPASHWNFIDRCLSYLEIGNVIFVHAGLAQYLPLDEQDQHHLFWKRFEEPLAYDMSKLVICGHTSRKNGEIADFSHTICIDTYAYGGQWLTCLNVTTGTFLKANNEGEVQKGALIGFKDR